jgi:hypothetical protein
MGLAHVTEMAIIGLKQRNTHILALISTENLPFCLWGMCFFYLYIAFLQSTQDT